MLQELGLKISREKLVAPSTSAVCLGILINTLDRTIFPEKLSEIKYICKNCLGKKVVSKNQYQLLLGYLLCVTKCIRTARFFPNRILQMYRNNGQIQLDSEYFRYLNWFVVFLEQYNGVTFYDNRPLNYTIYLDASLTGLGGTFKNMVYALSLPLNFRDYNIVHLKILNLVVAFRVWGHYWADRHIAIQCDNMAVVQVLTSGKTRNPILALCARNIWLLAAIYNIHLSVSHIIGRENHVADLLSRWDHTHDRERKLKSFLPNHVWMPVHLDHTLLNHNI